MLIKFKRLHPDAVIPTQRQGDVGFDLYSVEDTTLVQSVTKVRTGLAIAGYNPSITLDGGFIDGPAVCPTHGPRHPMEINDCSFFPKYEHVITTMTLYPKIEGRSGLALQGVFPVGGIIDPSYRGEIIVALANISTVAPIQVKKGDRIAQLVFYASMVTPDITLAESDIISDTERGVSGFGSTGR